MSRLWGVPALWVILVLSSGRAAADLHYEERTTSDGVSILVVSGVFELGDDLRDFDRAVARIRPVAVVFDSPGGQPQKAMELGRLIRALGLATFQPYGPQCVSACALAFVGGVERFADPGSIGVHKTYFDEGAPLDAAGAVAAIQELTAETLEYLGEMGVDPALLALSMRYDRNDMRYLSGSEMAELGVTTADGPQRDAAGPELERHPAYAEQPNGDGSRSVSPGPQAAPAETAAAGAGPSMPQARTRRVNTDTHKACCD
jgi:hypothetical protein